MKRIIPQLTLIGLLFFPLYSQGTHTISLEDFKTGPRFWKAFKDQSQLLWPTYRHTHAQFEKKKQWEILKETIEMHRNKELKCPMQFKLHNCIQEGLGVTFQVDPLGVAQLKVFLAFNEAMAELLDIEHDLIQKSKYIHKDLTTLQAFYKDALLFIEKSNHLAFSLLNGKESRFSEETFLESLKPTYTNADYLTQTFNKCCSDAKNEQEGLLTLNQYINCFIYMRSTLMMNGLAFVTAHLRSRDKITRKFLNPKRTITSDISGFKFKLSTGLHKDEQEALNDIISITPSVSGNTVPKTVKQKKEPPTKKLTPKPKKAVQPKQRITKTDPSLPLKNTISPAIESSDSIKSTPQLSEKPPLEDKASPSTTEDANNLPLNNDDPQQEMEQLHEIDELLQKYDGGPTKGMKTRRFLRLCSTLNKMGYFDSFEATQKEVKLKVNPNDNTPGIVTVMHTHHSKKKKDHGITRPTAQKLKQVIDILKTHYPQR